MTDRRAKTQAITNAQRIAALRALLLLERRLCREAIAQRCGPESRAFCAETEVRLLAAERKLTAVRRLRDDLKASSVYWNDVAPLLTAALHTP